MLSVDHALETILNNVYVLESQDCPLINAIGQVCAEDIYADMNVPDWDSSARDGFAVKSEDIQGASPDNPRILRVIETVMAGSTARLRVDPETAIRIMTGAPLPAGADCVVKFEDTNIVMQGKKSGKRLPSEVAVRHPEKPGSNIRKAGEQVSRSSLVVPQNALIGPAEIGVLASLGHTQVKAVKRPVAAIIGTGEELALPGKPLVPPQIYNGNSYNIGAQVARCGAIPQILGIARDNRTDLLKKIHQGMRADMVITTGGVSFGDRDLVKGVISEIGELMVEHVSMSPGKSFSFGMLNGKDASGNARRIPHFALAGNPPASMINFEILVRPAIFKMMNKTNLNASGIIEATLEDTIENRESFQHYEWVTVRNNSGNCYARPTRTQSREVLSSIVLANGLAVIPEGCQQINKGEKAQIILLDWR